MDKVKKILEAYVEWIALGLGACFLLWMVYSYVVLPPVTVPVGPSPAVLPGDIDGQIWNGPGKTLKAQIDARIAPVKVPVPAFSETVATALNKSATDTAPLGGAWNVYAMATDGPVIPVVPDEIGGHKDDTKVTALPIAPKPINVAIATGHSNTMPAPDASTGTPAAAGPANGNGAVPIANVATDKGWVTVAVTVPAAEMNAEFMKAKIPAQMQLRQTTMLRVELYREEMGPDGNWGPETLIAPPAIDKLPDMAPAAAVDVNAARLERSYLDFAGKCPGLILRPAFYQIVQGDKWYVPGTTNPNIKADELVDAKFDPATYTGSLDDLDKDQKDAVMKARRDAIKAANAAKQAAQKAAQLAAQQAARARSSARGSRGAAAAPAGPGGPAGGAGGGGAPGGFLVADPDRAAVAMADDPSIFEKTPRPVQPPADVPPPGMDAPGMTPPQGDAASMAQGADLPKGSFDPATQKDFMVWAHDETVKPGKTYRYRIRYVISSPVFLTQQLCKPQVLANVFAITSEKSDWSATVNVESDSNFYASGIGPKGSVTFDVFKWQGGVWTMKTVNVEPGDTIAGADWTVVDVRDVPNDLNTNKLVVLASDNGIQEREIKLDKKSKTYHELLVKIHGPNAQQPPPPGGMPGEPAGPGGPGTQPPPMVPRDGGA